MRPLCVLLVAITVACATSPPPSPASRMDDVAEEYVRLVLALGRHDADYVDAYFGPPEWKAESDSVLVQLGDIRRRAAALVDELRPVATQPSTRARGLVRHLEALVARADMLEGKRLTFDEESRALYDAVAPTNTEQHFQHVLDSLQKRLHGTGSVLERYDAFRRQFIIPRERVDTVFRAAVAACKDRTAAHLALPSDESFTIEYVTDKSWSGYNWYQGGYRSLIQVNVDLPIYIDRALDLACHEGYPGHHVFNALREQVLVRQRGWVEYSVYPLFSPSSLIAEGSANYGIELAFPGEERVRFERDVLFPLAGLDPERAGEYYAVKALTDQLAFAGNEAARRYLDGTIDAAAAADWLVRFALYSPERARQRVRFMDQYRSYVINYNLGQELVRQYVERRAGEDDAKRWSVFAELLASPTLPSELR